ncbi:MAG: FAD-dependent monooxygenase [Roseivivax sp.]|nr:FAD-dependent monooxygenase [Roseivivax sp.]
MPLSAHTITIIGGGIGGLACALALRQRGAEVRVLEQADALSEVGAGIQISPNGFNVIRVLGLGPALEARSLRARAVSLRDYRRGSEVLQLNLRNLPPEQGYFFVHRADILDILANAVRDAGVKIRLLQKVETVLPGSPARIVLSTGDTLDSDLVIGADGLHSVARSALNGTVAPFFTGQVAWRAIVPNVTGHPVHARVHMGPGRHLVSYPLRDGSIVNLVAVQERQAWAEEGWSIPDDPRNLKAAFAEFDAEVHRLLEEVKTVYLWGLFRHPVARNWIAENVALLGDAAHPTLPFMAQGANMALEDAWVMARALSEGKSLEQGLTFYRNLRLGRVTRVVEAANGNAWRYHLRPGPVRFAAHLGLRAAGLLAPGMMLRQYDWLYRHDVTA